MCRLWWALQRFVVVAVASRLARGTLAAVLTAAALAACGVRGAQIEGSPLLRYFERAAGQIAYLGLDGNVYTIDQKGNQSFLVTKDAGGDGPQQIRYLQPTWAPDGRHLAFGRLVTNVGDAPSGSVVVADREGHAITDLLGDGPRLPIHLSWGPTSHSVAILSQQLGEFDLELGIAAVPLNGEAGPGYHPVDRGVPYYWDWTPDGSSLLTNVNGRFTPGDASRLAFLEVEVTDAPPAPLPIRPARFQSPQVSGDGNGMVYVELVEGAAVLVWNKIQGTRRQVITPVPGHVYFSLAHDGKRLAYLKSPTIGFHADGTLKLRNLTNGDEHTAPEQTVMAFYWSPNSRLVGLPGASPS